MAVAGQSDVGMLHVVVEPEGVPGAALLLEAGVSDKPARLPVKESSQFFHALSASMKADWKV